MNNLRKSVKGTENESKSSNIFILECSTYSSIQNNQSF